MSRNRLVIIFLFFALTLISCNLSNMLPGNQEEPEPVQEITAETSVNSLEDEPMETNESEEKEFIETENDSNNSSGQNSQTSSGQQTACDHPYFPLREGATWVYFEAAESDYHHWEVVSVEGNLQNATAVMTSHIGEFSELTESNKQEMISIEYNWICSASEGIVSFDLAVLEIPQIGGQEFEMTMTLIEGEGVLLPPSEQLEPGFSWTMIIQTEFSIPALMNAAGTMVATDTYTVLNKELVDLNGQSFEGLQYQRDFSTKMEFSLSGLATSMQNEALDFQSVNLLAKGVGFVNIDTDSSDFGNTGIRLVRYNIP